MTKLTDKYNTARLGLGSNRLDLFEANTAHPVDGSGLHWTMHNLHNRSNVLPYTQPRKCAFPRTHIPR